MVDGRSTADHVAGNPEALWSAMAATLKFGGASLLTLGAAVISAKLSAVLLGPAGIGLLSLLQSLVGLAGLVVGLGVSTALVRVGGPFVTTGDEGQVAALTRTSRTILVVSVVLATIPAVVMRERLADALLGGAGRPFDLTVAIAAIACNLDAGVSASVLMIHRRVNTLAKLAAANGVLGNFALLVPILAWRRDGIGWGVLAAAGLNWFVTDATLRRKGLRRSGQIKPASVQVWRKAQGLLSVGLPVMMSGLLGAGVQTALPLLVLHMLSAADVGYMRPAFGLTVYLFTFISGAMANDLFPRLAGAPSTSAAAADASAQHRLVLFLVGPPLILLVGGARWLVPALYAPSFLPAVPLLEWQAAASVFRFSSWPFSHLILARGRPSTFLMAEACAGTLTVAAAVVGTRYAGLEGLGMALVVTYAVYFAIIGGMYRSVVGRPLNRENVAMTGILLVSVGLPAVTGRFGFITARVVLAVVLGGTWAALGFHRVFPALRRGRGEAQPSLDLRA